MTLAEERSLRVEYAVALVMERLNYTLVCLDPFVTIVAGMVVGIAVIIAAQSPQGGNIGDRCRQRHKVDLVIGRDLWYTGY